jgi:hypothetical protein
MNASQRTFCVPPKRKRSLMRDGRPCNSEKNAIIEAFVRFRCASVAIARRHRGRLWKGDNFLWERGGERIWVLGLRQINTCCKVPLQVNFCRWRHLGLPPMSLIFRRLYPIILWLTSGIYLGSCTVIICSVWPIIWSVWIIVIGRFSKSPTSPPPILPLTASYIQQAEQIYFLHCITTSPVIQHQS